MFLSPHIPPYPVPWGCFLVMCQPFRVLNNYRWQGHHAIPSRPHYLPDSIMSSRTVTVPTTVLCVPRAEPISPPPPPPAPPRWGIAGQACSSEAKLLTGKPAYPGLPYGKKSTVRKKSHSALADVLTQLPWTLRGSKMALTSGPGVLTTALCPQAIGRDKLEEKKRSLPLS